MDFCKQRCCRFCEYRKGIITILCNIVNSSEADRVLILPIKIKWNLKLFRRRMGFKKTSNWNNAPSTHGAEFINQSVKPIDHGVSMGYKLLLLTFLGLYTLVVFEGASPISHKLFQSKIGFLELLSGLMFITFSYQTRHVL